MEKQEMKIKLPYVEKVSVTYQTYEKAIYDCIGHISDIVKNSSAFLAVDIPQYIQLLNMLNSQLVQVKAFLSEYKNVDEVV